MKRNVLFFPAVILYGCMLFAQNPFIRDQFTADPTARVFEGKVYVYPSHDIPSPVERLKTWFCMADYHVFSSENLLDWTDHGVIVSQEDVPWIDSLSYSLWAPDCVFYNDKYYFYFPAAPNDTLIGKGMMVGVAIADRPYGPFIPQVMPIKGISGIDPCVLIDDDGQAYIYWAGRGNLMGAKLKENMLELDSDPILIGELPGKGLKEGPFVFKRHAKYYFTFPWVRDKTEVLVYAMGDSPLGHFDMVGDVMDESPSGCWTNHHSIIEYRGQWYLFYHHNDLSPHFDKNRSIRVDSLTFNPDGTIQKVIPTLRGVGLSDAQREIHLDRYSRLSDKGARIDFIHPENTFDGWKTIFDTDGAWIQYNGVDFGNKQLYAIKARTMSPTGGKLIVRKGGMNGIVVAEIDVPQGMEWAETHTRLSYIPAGVDDLCVSMSGGGAVEIDWVRFCP